MKTLHFGFIFNSLSAFSVFVFVFTTLYLLLSIINVPTAFASVVFEMPTDGGTSILSWGTDNSDLGLSVGETIFPSGFPDGFSGVCRVSVWLGKAGGVSDNVVLSVYQEQTNSLNPDDQLLIDQVTVSGSSLPTNTDTETTFILDNCTTLPFGTYWYVLERSNPNSEGYYTVEVTNQGQYPSMFLITEDTEGIWTSDNTRELRIRLETNDQTLDREPVIFIPGILGTRLNRADTGEEVWPNVEKMFNPLISQDYLDFLSLDEAGQEELNKITITGDLVDEVGILGKDIYQAIVSEFLSRNYNKGDDFYVFVYDWRKNLIETIDSLNQKIGQISEDSPTGKVKIVAHSLGGVLVDQYISSGNRGGLISQVILVGTPHLGATKAFKMLNYGDDMGMSFLSLGLDSNKTKHISQNMPSVYQLLPSREYITRSGGYSLIIAKIEKS